MQKSKQPKPQPISITEIIAVNKTADARRLLKAYNKPDANGYADLQLKLLALYQDAPDKLELEKKLAQMHPHKEWILQHCAPMTVKAGDIDTAKNLTVKDIEKQYSNCEGNPNCSCSHSNACGCSSSSFDGTGPKKSGQTVSKHTEILGIAALAAVSFLFCYTLIKLETLRK